MTDAEHMLSAKEVCAWLSISTSTLYQWMADDEAFPRPYKLSGNCVRWKKGELSGWLEARPKTLPARAS